MNSSRLTLRFLCPEDDVSFKNAVAAFRNATPPFEFAFDFDESISFEAYAQKPGGWPLGQDLPDKFVPSTFLVGVVDGQIVGRVSLRHCLNNFLARTGGHIG